MSNSSQTPLALNAPDVLQPARLELGVVGCVVGRANVGRLDRGGPGLRALGAEAPGLVVAPGHRDVAGLVGALQPDDVLGATQGPDTVQVPPPPPAGLH